MDSIKNIFKIGLGPSSSHTMGPHRAAEIFHDRNPNCKHFRVTLYGSLGATGKGHLTDVAIKRGLGGCEVEYIWKPDVFLPEHPNGMLFEALDSKGKTLDNWTSFSIGGGNLLNIPSAFEDTDVYPFKNMSAILEHITKNGMTYWEFIQTYENKDIWDYMKEVWHAMTEAIHRGLNTDGVLPGPLRRQRKAMSYYLKASGFTGTLKRKTSVYSYALAVSEENAAGGKVVTAPTCGSCGVLPAILYHLHKDYNIPESRLYKALATAGLFGNIIRHNASISGAEVGCQGEVGSACAMAAAATTFLFGGTPPQIEYAAEIGLEHHLGLTCDPVYGLVQVPCIERNVFAAEAALDASAFAILSDGIHLVSFDHVVEAMKTTGHDLPNLYKETSEGGLAILFGNNDQQK